MRVVVERRYYFDEVERHKREMHCLYNETSVYDFARKNQVSTQYVYRILAGQVEITEKIRKMFKVVGYEVSKE